jgi:hypothetical protein
MAWPGGKHLYRRDPPARTGTGRSRTWTRRPGSADDPRREARGLRPIHRSSPSEPARRHPVGAGKTVVAIRPMTCYGVWTSSRRACGGAGTSKAFNRCCFVREFDRKPDLSRLSVRAFGPFLPVVFFSSPRQYHSLKGGTPWVRRFMSVGCPIRRPSLS